MKNRITTIFELTTTALAVLFVTSLGSASPISEHWQEFKSNDTDVLLKEVIQGIEATYGVECAYDVACKNFAHTPEVATSSFNMYFKCISSKNADVKMGIRVSAVNVSPSQLNKPFKHALSFMTVRTGNDEDVSPLFCKQINEVL